MNSSTLSLSLCMTLSLILIISNAPLPTLGTSLYESLCNQVGPDRAKCLDILKAEPGIVGAKDNVVISKLILKLGLKRAIEAQIFLKGVMKNDHSPAIKQCATTLYDGVIGSFKSSLAEMKEDSLTANYDAKAAGDGPTTCDRALGDAKIINPSVSALNKDILLLSKLAFLATNDLPEDDS